ncbi:MAG: polysaccharide deacetylase family protein [Actinomycetota bacterium]
MIKDAVRDVAYRAAAAAAGPARLLRAILMLHELDGPAGPTRKVFRDQLRLVADSANVVRLDALADAMSTNEPTVVITFDDGDRRTCELACEELSQAAVPATFFLPSRLLGSTFATSFGARELIDDAGARELVAMRHELGAHTLTHPNLTGLTGNALLEEIAGSRRDLEALTGARVRTFAYPKGKHDRRVVEAVRASGFDAAVTVREGLVHDGADLLTLPRIAVRASTGTAQLRAKLTRGVELYERLKGRL